MMDAISEGEVPDLRLLPSDLQQHLKLNSGLMLSMFTPKTGDHVSTRGERDLGALVGP